MDEYRGILWGNTTRGPTVEAISCEHMLTSHIRYIWLEDPVDTVLKQYLDFHGERFIPVVLDNSKTIYVNVDYCDEVMASLETDSHKLPKQTTVINEPLRIRFKEFYTGDIPKHLQVLFDLYGVKFITFSQGKNKYHVYEKTFAEVCKKLCAGNNGPLPQPEIMTLDGKMITLRDFYTEDSSWEYIKTCLLLVCVKTVAVRHSQIYHVPVCNLSLVAKRLGLFI